MTRCCVYLRSKLSKFLHDVLAEPARFYFWRFLRRLELPRCDANDPCQESGRARVGLCWAPSSRMIDRISPTIRNEPVTRIQPRPRANADARITALRGFESSSAARSSSSAKRRSLPGAHDDLSRCAVRNYARNHRCSAFQNSDLLESDGSVSGAENGRVLKADIG